MYLAKYYRHRVVVLGLFIIGANMYSTYSPHFVLIPISINNAHRRVQSRPLTMDEPGQDLAGGGGGRGEPR